jgi:hypothetical protein
MSIPGFHAQAALSITNRRFQLVGNNHEFEAAGRVLPQKESQTHCANNPKNICEYVCCTISYIPPFDIPSISCNTTWVCLRRRPDAGISLQLL